jgi:hypothetical protein
MSYRNGNRINPVIFKPLVHGGGAMGFDTQRIARKKGPEGP